MDGQPLNITLNDNLSHWHWMCDRTLPIQRIYQVSEWYIDRIVTTKTRNIKIMPKPTTIIMKITYEHAKYFLKRDKIFEIILIKLWEQILYAKSYSSFGDFLFLGLCVLQVLTLSVYWFRPILILISIWFDLKNKTMKQAWIWKLLELEQFPKIEQRV